MSCTNGAPEPSPMGTSGPSTSMRAVSMPHPTGACGGKTLHAPRELKPDVQGCPRRLGRHAVVQGKDDLRKSATSMSWSSTRGTDAWQALPERLAHRADIL